MFKIIKLFSGLTSPYTFARKTDSSLTAISTKFAVQVQTDNDSLARAISKMFRFQQYANNNFAWPPSPMPRRMNTERCTMRHSVLNILTHSIHCIFFRIKTTRGGATVDFKRFGSHWTRYLKATPMTSGTQYNNTASFAIPAISYTFMSVYIHLYTTLAAMRSLFGIFRLASTLFTLC